MRDKAAYRSLAVAHDATIDWGEKYCWGPQATGAPKQLVEARDALRGTQ